MRFMVCYRTGELGGYYTAEHEADSEDDARLDAEKNGVTRGNGYDIWAVLPMQEP